MFKHRDDFVRKIHLIISVLIVLPVGIVYGFYPDIIFDLHPETMDELNFFKAVMGVYLASVVLWLIGIIKPGYFKAAIISNIIFMLGLGCGRVVSILLDGTPGFGYLFGTFAELFLGLYGIWVLKQIK